jgi:multidrug resistance efflux pump
MSSVVRKPNVKANVKRVRDSLPLATAPTKKWLRRLRRRAVPITACAVALAVLIPFTMWARYRAVYVVARNALVKGTITNIGAQIDGVVTSVDVEAGTSIRAGQILARFEDHQLQASVQRAASKLEKATRQLEVERLAIEQERKRLGSLVNEASARVGAAKAKAKAADSQADDARLRYEMRQTLAKNGVITQEELRSAESTRRTSEALGESATADRRAAEAARQLAVVEADGMTVRERNLVVLEAEIAAFRAELSLAQADLEAALIRAPADGWVLRRISEAGSSVVVGQPIVALWIGKDVWVEAWIDENDLGKCKVGNAARITLESYPGRVFAGSVESIGVSTDYELPDAAVPQSRNQRLRTNPIIAVRVRIPDAEGLFPGLSAEVGIRKKSS